MTPAAAIPLHSQAHTEISNDDLMSALDSALATSPGADPEADELISDTDQQMQTDTGEKTAGDTISDDLDEANHNRFKRLKLSR